MPIRREYISSLYRDLLGREGSEGEISGHVDNPGGEEGLRQFFLDSPEYARIHGGQAKWEDRGGNIVYDDGGGNRGNNDGTRNTNLPTDDRTPIPSLGFSPNPYTGFAPRYDYSAFDTRRQQDPGKSAKDAYAMITNSAPPPPLHDRAAFKQWLNTYVVPGMNALGHRVISVDDNGFTYTNHEGTFYVDAAQNLGAPAGTRDQRLHWNATPADEATRRRYPEQVASGGGGGGRSPLAQFLPGGGFGGPGDPGVFKGPVQQVGQDPFSQLITDGLADLILNKGMTPEGQRVFSELEAIIASGGRGDASVRNRRFESARELMAKGERTALNDSRAALAARGLLSEPGKANRSGAESSTIGRIQTRNAEEFARALRDIGIADDDAASTRTMQALSLATGMSQQQAQTYLSTLGASTDRQNMLARIALENLQTNMAWNQFLATFGLERDKAMYAIQNGQIDQILPYLALFLQLAQGTQRGYV